MIKKISGIVAGIFIFSLTLGGLFFLFEKSADYKRKQNLPMEKKLTSLTPGKEDQNYESFPRAPESGMNIKLVKGDHIFYDQNYYSDKYLFRVPMPEIKIPSYHTIFAGGSYTWGEGLQENETLPWLFQLKFKKLKAYNLGFPGGSVNTLLRYMEFFNLREAVQESEGLYIYLFMSNHFDRFFASYNYLSWAPENYPHYEIENGIPVFKGAIKDQSSYKKFHAARKMGLENTLLNTQDPEKWDEDEILKFTLAVKELKKRYQAKFPEGKFIMVFHPEGGFGGVIRDHFEKYLNRENIIHMDFRKEYAEYLIVNRLTPQDMKIPDGHPNARMNSFLADVIAERVKTEYQNLR